MCVSCLCLENEGRECWDVETWGEGTVDHQILEGGFFDFDRKSVEIEKSEYIVRKSMVVAFKRW